MNELLPAYIWHQLRTHIAAGTSDLNEKVSSAVSDIAQTIIEKGGFFLISV